MSNLIPEKLALLGRAAELRASGAGWTAVATDLKVADDELRSLRNSNARAYDRLARRAEREYERETARASLARLRELLKSSDDGAAMLAAGTIIRYELARMRHEVHAERKDQQRRFQKIRNELPPLPGSKLHQSDSRCDTGCDRTRSTPKTPVPQRIAAQPAVVEKTRCDSPAAATVTVEKPTLPATLPIVAKSVSPPPAPQGKTTLVDAIRRKKWLPKGL